LRYFAHIQYRGGKYAGWQRQPNANSVQSECEHALSTIFREEISIMGCGRTDAGVHAKDFYFHFDTNFSTPALQINRLNGFLPKDIVILGIYKVGEEAHARFDANYRAYEYHLSFKKDPFLSDLIWQVPLGGANIDREQLNKVAELIKEHDTFFPFCKTNHDAHTLKCTIFESHWEELENDQMVYNIAANRFLRGMVRLIVGCSIRVATGKISLEEIQDALKHQTRIHNAYSAPAQGLFLTKVKYPDSVGLPLT
jgi:tRNA pseudouridine38-40 synthase